MDKQNLHAHLYFFDGQQPPEVRAALARGLNCVFDEEFAKSDEFGTTWFGDALGFEISFKLMSRREDGAWYLVTLSPAPMILDAEAPMHGIEFHLSQILRNAGFSTIATAQEYRDRYYKPTAPPKT